MEKVFLTLCIIVGSLTGGYMLRRLTEKGIILAGQDMVALRRCMQSFALFGCIPLSAMLSLWGLPAPDVRLLGLPLLGVVNWVAGGLCALGASRLLRLSRAQTGSMFCCGSFTNIGALGGLVCLLFLGEQSIALVALYRLCEDLYYFAVGMPVARSYGESSVLGARSKSLLSVLCDPVLQGVVAALGVGVLLNWLDVSRPWWGGLAASALVLLATALFLTAVGMSLRFSRISLYTRQWLCIAAIKFICAPFVVCSLAMLLGLGHVEDGLVLQTVLILSCMPVAMNALVLPSLFRLDLDLANTCWICTTASLLVVLPLLLLLLPYMRSV